MQISHIKEQQTSGDFHHTVPVAPERTQRASQSPYQGIVEFQGRLSCFGISVEGNF